MRTFYAVATATIAVPLLAVAQEAARDITREMGADTATSVSQGLDRTGLHRNTERVRRGQHAPSLLEAPQGETSNVKKLSKSQRRQLQRERDLLLKDRTAAMDAAATATGASNRANRVYSTSEQRTEDVAAARKNAKREWDAKWGQQLQSIDRAITQGSEGGKRARFHAPSLINPK